MLTIKNYKLFILLTLLLLVCCCCCNGSTKGSKTLLDVKKCKTTSYPSDCPDNAQCSQETTDSFNNGKSSSSSLSVNPSIEGVCTCIENYHFNQEYSNDTEYCRLNGGGGGGKNGTTESTTTTTTTSTTSSTSSSVNNKLPRTEAATSVAAASSSLDENKKQLLPNNVQPSSHHILGGIFISICVVLVFIVGIIGYRKLQLKQRWRNLLMPSARGGGIGGGGGVGGIVGNSRQRRGRPLYEDVMLSNDTDDPPLI